MRKQRPPATTQAPLDEPRLRNAAAEIGVELDAPALARFAAFAALLVRWNAVHNLTAIRSPEELLTHHLLDSLALVPALRERFDDRAFRLLDVGSGAGLPAVPVAIAMPNAQVTSIDAVGKKIAFQQQVRADLQLANLHPVHGRVEQLNDAGFDAIVSRAFASLADFVAGSRSCLAPGGRWYAMKGQRPDAELQALPPNIATIATVTLRVPLLSGQRHLVELAEIEAAAGP